MNDRERFKQISRFSRCCDPYYFQHIFWIETLERWHSEGLPKEVHPHRIISLGQDKTEWLPLNTLFNFGRPFGNPPYYTAIMPSYMQEIIKDEGKKESFNSR